MRARRVSRRWKNRQCRSVHSTIGAMQNLRANSFILFAFFLLRLGSEKGRPISTCVIHRVRLFFYDHQGANGKQLLGPAQQTAARIDSGALTLAVLVATARSAEAHDV